MDPLLALTLINGLIDLTERLVPHLQGGTISVEDQSALMKRIDDLRSGLAFSGPEWKPQPETGTPPATVG